MKKIKLNVLGISYSQTQSGAYALVLAEEEGERRLPIIIGGFEAQAIVIKLENLDPPRPLTHDLFRSFSDTFDVSLKEVFIHKLDEGVFFSQLVLKQKGKETLIDSRTSDAVALALRFDCPIYISADIMEKAGIIMDESELEDEQSLLTDKPDEEDKHQEDMSGLSMKELKEKLDKAVKTEDYEGAASIKEEIDRRKKGQ